MYSINKDTPLKKLNYINYNVMAKEKGGTSTSFKGVVYLHIFDRSIWMKPPYYLKDLYVKGRRSTKLINK